MTCLHYRNEAGQLYIFDGKQWRKGTHRPAGPRWSLRSLGWGVAKAAGWAAVGFMIAVACMACAALTLWGLAELVTALF